MRHLEPGAVDVWIAALDGDPPLEWCLAVLSAAERERVERYRFENLRRRFIVAHGFVRDVLAQYLGVAPEAIEFENTEHGKPFVPSAEIQFNLSHSGELAALAITRGVRIGVDIECVRAVPELDGIIDRFFAEGEGRRIREAAERERAFFECWTRKEAYIKAVGGGFSIPLTSFDTSGPVVGWTIAELPAIRECLGAVALEGAIKRLQVWRWSGPLPDGGEPESAIPTG